MQFYIHWQISMLNRFLSVAIFSQAKNCNIGLSSSGTSLHSRFNPATADASGNFLSTQDRNPRISSEKWQCEKLVLFEIWRFGTYFLMSSGFVQLPWPFYSWQFTISAFKSLFSKTLCRILTSLEIVMKTSWFLIVCQKLEVKQSIIWCRN